MNRWEIEKKAAIKAIKDPAFKKRLMSHPVDAIKEIDRSYTGKVAIKVVEEKQNEWILAIPHFEEKHQHLSESELEKMFGGFVSAFGAIC